MWEFFTLKCEFAFYRIMYKCKLYTFKREFLRQTCKVYLSKYIFYTLKFEFNTLKCRF